ncbi:hypothetical protein GO685_04160 [Wolbachia endosymbiont of Madathamugadia hiepei]|uniref:hypothetical protein n=1 Tax=Wolbachia endosymbiont of Madathamugadia hiepei TaxID=1241303 RepID=UPI0015890594|nr:hypothetical protein [Wolbachia endosymbiont of Madathamugadia hiepei]NUX01663.1 hypothetical protein [Wolbachia endosymbiont of Madathamugadia hiepei]
MVDYYIYYADVATDSFFSLGTTFSTLLVSIKQLVSVKKVYHEKIRKDVAKTGSLT